MITPDLPTWRKSRRSGGEGGNCIELTYTLDAMRDSKNPNGTRLNIDLAPMLAAIKAGRLDR